MSMIDKLQYVIGLEKKHGFRGLLIKAMEKRDDVIEADYRIHYENYLATEEELIRQKNTVLGYHPRISVVVPTYETPELFLRQLLDSLMAQSYENWELCIADGSNSDAVRQIVEEYICQDSTDPKRGTDAVQNLGERIRYQHIDKNDGISGNTNVGFTMATGDYIGLLDHDDLLAPNALFEVALALNQNPNAEMLYSDEDKVDANLTAHMQPHFKLDYNPQLLLRYNYICHFLVVSAKLREKVGGLNREFDGSQDYDFVLRCTEHTSQVVHIPKILYHWRVHENSTAGNSLSKDYAYQAGLRALQAHVDRQNMNARVFEVKGREFYQLQYNHAETIDFATNLAKCTPEHIQVLTRGEEINYILLQSEEIRSVKQEDIRRLYELCCQPGVGMVGAKLYDKRKRVYSCGLEQDENGQIHHGYQGMKGCYKGYFRRATVPQNASAIDLDFCMIKKEAWKQVGGLNLDLDRPQRDVEYAKRMQAAGYEVILNPQATAIYRG